MARYYDEEGNQLSKEILTEPACASCKLCKKVYYTKFVHVSSSAGAYRSIPYYKCEAKIFHHRKNIKQAERCHKYKGPYAVKKTRENIK